jgi:endonuclease G
MSGTNGKIALVIASQLPTGTCGATATPCSTAQLAAIVDWVAYGAAGNGTAGNGEGGTSVNNGTAITSTQGAVRKGAGCTDTDNNNLDFDVVSNPVPRNTSTTPAPCSNTTNPSGVGASNPNSVLPGATTLLTVTVTPGANPASTGLTVTADLSSIGGSATQAFFDNGTNGDVTAGDNIFSFNATVSAQAASGAKSLPFSITDTQARSGSGNIALTVQGTTPTNPSGVGSANPSTAAPGDLTQLTVTVTPGTNPTSTNLAVTVDLTSIGGSATQPFLDDGLNGDDVAGDNIFSYFATVPSNATLGTKSFAASITDGQSRSGSATISFTVASSAGVAEHLAFGNPTSAVSDPNQPNNYLLVKSQYVMSYNCSRGIPNWVAWHLDPTWIGSSGRNDSFRPDPALSAIPNCYQVQDTDYSTGGFDRGHHCPSGDRTRSVTDNQATFFMTNMMPQASDNNQGVWADLENYARTLVSQGNEIYIYAGGAGQGGNSSGTGTINTIANGHVVVPAVTWKVMVVIPQGSNDADRVTKNTRTIAVIMDNRNDTMPSPGQGNWRNYRVSIKKVEALTGYNFLTGLRPIVRNTLKYRVDTQ